MATIRDIMNAIEQTILATPAPEPTGLPYTAAPGVRALLDASHAGSDTQREFAVEAGTVQSLGEFIGPCWMMVHSVAVFIRYAHDENRDDYAELQRMAASDAGRIISALIKPGDSLVQDAGASNVRLNDHQKLEKLDEPAGVWLQGIIFDVEYHDADWI